MRSLLCSGLAYVLAAAEDVTVGESSLPPIEESSHSDHRNVNIIVTLGAVTIASVAWLTQARRSSTKPEEPTPTPSPATANVDASKPKKSRPNAAERAAAKAATAEAAAAELAAAKAKAKAEAEAKAAAEEAAYEAELAAAAAKAKAELARAAKAKDVRARASRETHLCPHAVVLLHFASRPCVDACVCACARAQDAKAAAKEAATQQAMAKATAAKEAAKEAANTTDATVGGSGEVKGKDAAKKLAGKGGKGGGADLKKEAEKAEKLLAKTLDDLKKAAKNDDVKKAVGVPSGHAPLFEWRARDPASDAWLEVERASHSVQWCHLRSMAAGGGARPRAGRPQLCGRSHWTHHHAPRRCIWCPEGQPLVSCAACLFPLRPHPPLGSPAKVDSCRSHPLVLASPEHVVCLSASASRVLLYSCEGRVSVAFVGLLAPILSGGWCGR